MKGAQPECRRRGAGRVEGCQVARWRDGERAYVAICDLDVAELGDFELAKKAAERAKTAL